MESQKANNLQNNQNMNIAIGGTVFFLNLPLINETIAFVNVLING